MRWGKSVRTKINALTKTVIGERSWDLEEVDAIVLNPLLNEGAGGVVELESPFQNGVLFELPETT